jgi:hypothetical protein
LRLSAIAASILLLVRTHGDGFLSADDRRLLLFGHDRRLA